ncbi:YraN family protein [Frondihabitans cladoniiphilus]|uniref:UPF0102 protein GCM10025780_02960 n=1 Tax=Frondihabitans cladoniiphilus TaxID=715785 RepID=A0ABP8VJG7_9MICO
MGVRGEDIAAGHLARSGWSILARNWRCSEGEADIVARDGCDVVVVEVKTRSSGGAGHPFEAVTPAKVARLRRIAMAWALEHPGTCRQVRLDAIAVTAPDGLPPLVEHLRAVGA